MVLLNKVAHFSCKLAMFWCKIDYRQVSTKKQASNATLAIPWFVGRQFWTYEYWSYSWRSFFHLFCQLQHCSFRQWPQTHPWWSMWVGQDRRRFSGCLIGWPEGKWRRPRPSPSSCWPPRLFCTAFCGRGTPWYPRMWGDTGRKNASHRLPDHHWRSPESMSKLERKLSSVRGSWANNVSFFTFWIVASHRLFWSWIFREIVGFT